MTKQEIEEWFKSLPEYKSYVEAIGEYNPELGYAGPESNQTLSKLIPETLYGIDCNLAFYQHDAEYAIGGDKSDRFRADSNMLITILFIIENTPNKWWLTGLNWGRKAAARRRALKYYYFVRAKGYEHFNFKKSPSEDKKENKK